MFSCKGRQKSLRNCGRGMAIRMQSGARRGACLHDHARGRQGLGGGTAELCRGRNRPLSRRARRAPRPEHSPGEGRGAARRGPGLAAETRPLGRAARRPASGRDRPRAAGARPLPTPRLPPASAGPPARPRPLRAPAPCGRRPGGPRRRTIHLQPMELRGPLRPRGDLLAGALPIARRPARRSRPREKRRNCRHGPRIARAGPLQGGITRPCFQQTP